MKHNFKYHKKRYILILSFIIIVVFLVLFKLGFLENKALKSALYWEQQGRSQVIDSSKKILTDKRISKETQANLVVKIEKEEPSLRDTSKIYYIIIGSFIDLENANLAVKQYTNQGYSTSIITTTNHYGKKANLISIKTFKNHNEAVKFLKEFQGKVDPKAWIYPNS